MKSNRRADPQLECIVLQYKFYYENNVIVYVKNTKKSRVYTIVLLYTFYPVSPTYSGVPPIIPTYWVVR